MKIKGFCLRQFQFVASSPNCKSFFFSHSSLLSLSSFRCFGTKSVANHNSREKMKLGLGNIRGLDDARCLYENMSRMRPLPSVIEFTQLLSSVVSLKEYSVAIYLFKDVCDLGISVDEYIMTIAINCYCLLSRTDFGFSILGWFFKRGCVPNEFTFNTLLKGLFHENRNSEAQELLRKVVREGLCKLNVVTYGTVIDGLCKAGNTILHGLFRNCRKAKMDDAMHIFREMPCKGVKPDVAAYNTILHGLFRCGRDSCALKLLDELQAAGLKPDFHTYCNMLDGFCRNDQVERASLLLDELEQKGEHLHITYYSIIMDGFCRAKKLDVARAIFKELASEGVVPDVVSYSILIKGCCQNGLLEEAKDLCLTMERASLLPNDFTYNYIVQANLKRGEYDDAARLLEEMGAKGFSPNASTLELLLDLLGTPK